MTSQANPAGQPSPAGPDMFPELGERAPTDKSVFTIGELAREFSVTHRALRFYEDKGLLNPKRRGTTRLYSRRDRARLMLLLSAKRLGFALGEIREMLDLYDLRDGQVTQIRFALRKFNEQRDILLQQKQEVESALTHLDRTCDVLAGMLKARGGDTAGCTSS